MAARIYISHAPEDATLRDELCKHLVIAERHGVLRLWHVGKIAPGEPTEDEARAHLAEASIVVLLVSVDHLAGNRTSAEMDRAIGRMRAGKAKVVPVLLRPCSITRTPFAGLQVLPSDGKPVTAWADRDDAWAEVATNLLDLVERESPAQDGPISREVRDSLPTSSGKRSRLDDDAIGKLAKLEDAITRRRRIAEARRDTGEVDEEILALKRQLREGGQVKQGDLLGDRYSLLRRVGRGGFATVWEAEDRQLHRTVAVKVLHASLAEEPERKDRFFRGARVMAEIEHPGIVRVIEPIAEDAGFCYFVMEYVAGGNLHEAVLKKRISPDRIVPLLSAVGEALSAAHAKGCVHRDIKPQNILLDEAGNPMLTDFDLVGVVGTTGGTKTGAMGTFLYAAPEVMTKPQDADVRADVYGLGMTAVFCYFGAELPFTLLENKQGFLDQLACPDDVKMVLRRAVTSDAAGRFASVGEFCGALRERMAFPAPEVSAPAGVASMREEGGKQAVVPPIPQVSTEPGEAPSPEAASAKMPVWLRPKTVVDRNLRKNLGIVGTYAGIVAAALVILWWAKWDTKVGQTTEDAAAQSSSVSGSPGTVAALTAAGTAAPAGSSPSSIGADSAAIPVATADATQPRASGIPDGVISAANGACPWGMILIPAGTFAMGSTQDEINKREADADEIAHEVTLSAFCIDRTEVTVQDYRACVTWDGSSAKCKEPPTTVLWSGYSPDDVRVYGAWCNARDKYYEGHPINCVDWNMAKSFCAWAGKRLPTEAEWEYAARGKTGRRYPWGDESPAPQRMNACGPECRDMGAKAGRPGWKVMYDEADDWPRTAPVGTFQGDTSAFGVLDMGGNLMEWVEGWYSSREPARVVRGGSWRLNSPRGARAASRLGYAINHRNIHVGFRCACAECPSGIVME